MNAAAAMLVALALDAGLGWPDALFRRIGHPVTWIGRLIAALDAAVNDEELPDGWRRLAGASAAGLVLLVAAVAAMILQVLLPAGVWGALLGGCLAWPLLAARSLHDHVAAVARPLAAGDTAGARAAVARIVGRDPDRLDKAAIARASLESLAENASDGVVAPLFWGAILGLPGIAAYKALNTLDSMIGHRTERHAAFGWAAARLDDLANLVPARLTGLLFVAVSAAPRECLAVMLRDARAHRSPNAGWPEAALAGALAVRLSGPRAYATGVAEEPWLNAAAADPTPDTLRAGLALYRRAVALAALPLLALALL